MDPDNQNPMGPASDQGTGSTAGDQPVTDSGQAPTPPAAGPEPGVGQEEELPPPTPSVEEPSGDTTGGDSQ